MNIVKQEKERENAVREQIEREYLNYCLVCLKYCDYFQFSRLSRKMGGLEGLLDLCHAHNIPAPIDDLKKWVEFVFALHAEQQDEARRVGF